MAASGGDLQGALRACVALHIREIRVAHGRSLGGCGEHPGPAVIADRLGRRRTFGRREELPHDVKKVPRPVDLGVRHQRGFLRAIGRQHEPRRDPARMQREGHGERTTDGPELPRKREFAGELVSGEPGRLDLPAGRQDAQGDRQVEASGVLRQVCRGQVHRDPFVVRKFETGVLDGGSHAFAGFLDFHIGKSDQREAGQTIRQMHLNRDTGRFEAQQGAALHQRQTHSSPYPQDGAPISCFIVTTCILDRYLALQAF